MPTTDKKHFLSSKRKPRPRSGRARAEAIVLDCRLKALAALAALAVLLRILEPFSLDSQTFSGRMLAAVVFLLFAALGSVCLRARAGKPGEKPQERTRNESPR